MHSECLDEDANPPFPLFPDLPTEIRLKIWAYALPGPRVIPINLSIKHHHITTCTSPVLLRVCQESRNLALPLYYRGFATTKSPYGIFIRPAIDIIYLQKPCQSSPVHECADCTNFELGIRLQRYNNINVVQTVAFYESLLVGRERENNMSYIHDAFPEIKNIVVKMNCYLDDFRHVRGGIEDEIQDLFKLVQDISLSHKQSLDFIRVTAINFTDEISDWDWTATPDLFYKNQQEIEQELHKHRQWDWEEAMDFYFPNLPLEERKKCWQVFNQLSPEAQREHLQRILDLEDGNNSGLNFIVNKQSVDIKLSQVRRRE